ncbi:MAG: hypothetical protein J6U39_03795, partial [Clostridia bacterium]|nr:hypothetical protein [Clostridia bacterium]
SGYRLAMMDLEIRGAGNVLGAEQHGHIEKVGYEMYCTLLKEAIAELNGEALPENGSVEMIVKEDAYLPDDYVTSELARIRFYKKIAAITDEKGKNAILSELEESFGMPPRQVHALVEIALLKGLASSLPIKRIRVEKETAAITYTDADFMTSAAMRNALALLSSDIREVGTSEGEIRYVVKGGLVSAKVRILIKFVKALRGEAVT